MLSTYPKTLCRVPVEHLQTVTTASFNTRNLLQSHLFKCLLNYTPYCASSTVAIDSIPETTSSWNALSASTSNQINDHQARSDRSKSSIWRPLLGSARHSVELGKRFFAQFPSSKSMPMKAEYDSPMNTAWRQSQCEDTHGMDKKMVKLLSLETDRLPKPCDPLTYCFWRHGMHRRFERVTDHFPSHEASTFTVCSYNVLCQRTLGYFVEQLYSHCPFEYLTWQRRWPLLAVELQMLNADVFCLQEVQADHFEQYYSPLLADLGYDGTFKKRLGQKSDGCATFWRRDKFKPVSIEQIEYVFPSPHDHSDSVAVISVLQPIDTERTTPVIVANTHLIYQPAFGATKLCQAALLLAHLQKVTGQYDCSPGDGQSTPSLIICGDFNSTPYSPLYSLMVEGRLHYQGLTSWSISGQTHSHGHRRLNAIGDAVLGSRLFPHEKECSQLCTVSEGRCHTGQDEGRLRHSLNLRSVYDHVTRNGEREVTTFLRDHPASVDYIFYSVMDKKIRKRSYSDGDLSSNYRGAWKTSDVQEGALRCLERYRLPGPSRLDRTIGYLPNQYCASDHLPLMAKFALE